jgi:hypothetical protein
VIVEYAPNGNLRDFLRKHRHDSNTFYEQPIGQPPDMKSLTYMDLINYAYQVIIKCLFLKIVYYFLFNLFRNDLLLFNRLREEWNI